MKSLTACTVLIISLFAIQPASAQLHFGALAKLNIAKLTADPADYDYSSRLGMGIGAVIVRDFNGNVAVQVEPMFLQKGSKEKDDYYDVTVKLNFFEIPILLKYAFGNGEIRPYVVAGPTIGFLMSAKVKGSGGGESFEQDIKDITKGMDFGLTFGVGATKPMGKNSLLGEVRYDAGLSNLNDDSDFPDATLKSSGIEVIVGILFGTSAN